MSDQITPGPWLRVDKADYAEIQSAFRPSSQAIALVGKPGDADAIALVPEMVEALRELAGWYHEFTGLPACSANAILSKLEAPHG